MIWDSVGTRIVIQQDMLARGLDVHCLEEGNVVAAKIELLCCLVFQTLYSLRFAYLPFPTSFLTMGYSYYCPSIVFGFYDDAHKDSLILDREYVYVNYNGVETYAGEINKNYNAYRVIGIQASIDQTTGQLVYSDEDYKSLEKLKADYEAYNDTKVTLEYHTVISGDYEEEEDTYTFDDDE
jgi:hypothetical protein